MRVSQLVSKVSVRGQTVIPQEIREALGIRAGTRLAWTVVNGSLLATPETGDPVRSTRGLLRGLGPTTAQLLESRREERAREAKLDARP